MEVCKRAMATVAAEDHLDRCLVLNREEMSHRNCIQPLEAKWKLVLGHLITPSAQSITHVSCINGMGLCKSASCDGFVEELLSREYA